MSWKKNRIVFLFCCSLAANRAAFGQTPERLIYSWQMKQAQESIQSLKSPSHYILGLYEFYAGNYRKAADHFKKVPERSAVLLKIIEDTLSVTDSFEETHSKYFIIRHTGKDSILALYLKDILDVCAQELHRRFDWKPETRVILEIYPDRKSFQSASTLTDDQIRVSGAIGICKFNRLMIASPRILKFGYSWPDTVTHEYVHYIIGKITGLTNMPLWLNEGLAKHLDRIWRNSEGQLTPVQANYLYNARQSGKWVPLEKMRYGMPNLDSQDEVTLAFAQVQAITYFLIQSYTWENMVKLLYELRDIPVAGAFNRIYGKSTDDLHKEWEEYIKETDLNYTAGARSPSYAFAEDPVSAVMEWVSETAMTDLTVADRFRDRSNYTVAQRKYEDALAKDPGNSVILNRLAKVQIKLGSRDEAAENFVKAIQANPAYPPPYIHLAGLYFELGNFEEASKCALDYIYQSPFNPDAHILLKDIYAKTREKKKRVREKKVLDVLLNEN